MGTVQVRSRQGAREFLQQKIQEQEAKQKAEQESQEKTRQGARDYLHSLADNYAAKYTGADTLSQLLTDIQGLEVPAATGEIKTTGGYYSRPVVDTSKVEEIGKRLDQLSSAMTYVKNPVERAEQETKTAATNLESAGTALQSAYEAYAASPTQQTALTYNQALRAYQKAQNGYDSAYGAYKTAYDKYQKAVTDSNAVFDAWGQYVKQSQTSYDNWKSTIRDADVVKQELDAVETRIKELEPIKPGIMNIINILGNAAANAAASSSSLGPVPSGAGSENPELAKLKAQRELLQEEYDWAVHSDQIDIRNTPYFGTLSENDRLMVIDMTQMQSWSNADKAKFENWLIARRNAPKEVLAWADTIGWDRLEEIESSLRRYQNQQNARETVQKAQEAAKGGWGGFLSSLGTIPAGLWNAVTSPFAVAQELLWYDDRYGNLDPNGPGFKTVQWAGAVRDTVGKNIAGDVYDTKGIQTEDGGLVRQGLSTLYQAGMSAADNLARLAVGVATGGGSTVTLGLAAMGSFGDTVRQISEQGGDPIQALGMGIISGGLEVLTEKYSVENILKVAKGDPLNLKKTLKEMLKQGAIEVSEEEINFLASTLAEAAIMGDSSAYNLEVKKMMAQGMTEAEAREEANLSLIQQATETAIQSFLSGGMMTGAISTANNFRFSSLGQKLGLGNATLEDAKAIIDSGLESAEDTEAHQMALKLQKKIDAGKVPTKGELAQQMIANEQTIKAEEATGENANTGIKEQLKHSQEKLDAMNSVADITVPSDFAEMDLNSKKNWVIEKLRPTGYTVERKGFGIIDFAQKKLRAAFNYFKKGSAEEAAFEALPYVLKNGIEISAREDHKGRKYSTVTIAAPVTINGQRGNMAVVVRQTQGNQYKVHRVVLPDGSAFYISSETENEAESSTTRGVAETGSLASSKDTASMNIIDQGGGIVNTNNQNGGNENANADGQAGADSAEGAGVLYGSGQRNVGTSTGEQTGSLDGSAETTAQRTERLTGASRIKKAVARQTLARSLRLPKVSAQDIGLTKGTEGRSLCVLPQEHWDDELQSLAQKIREETDREAVFVVGEVYVQGKDRKNHRIRAAITDAQVILQADYTKLPLEQILDHEIYHYKAAFVRENNHNLDNMNKLSVLGRFSKEEFQAVLDAYIAALDGQYGLSEAVERNDNEAYREILALIQQEMMADAYAGINAFGAGADKFTKAVNDRMEGLNLGKKTAQENGVRQTNGPNAEQSTPDAYQNGDFAEQNTQNAEREARIAEILDSVSTNHAAQFERYTRLTKENPELAAKEGEELSKGIYRHEFMEYRELTDQRDRAKENTAKIGGERYSASDYEEYRKPITEQDVAILRSIGRKSVNAFSDEDLQKAQKWAYKFYQEMGTKSPFFRSWFGEWRAYDTKKVKIATIPPYTDSNEARRADRGEVSNKDTRWTINVSREGQTNTIAHSGSNRMSEYGLSGIKELIGNAYLLDTEVHEHHSNNTKNDLIAFDHRLYALGQNANGEVALYRITVEDYFQSKKQPSNKRFHNLKYIEKIADISSGRTFGQNRSGGSTDGISAITYTVADLVEFVKQYDADYNVGKKTSAICYSDGTPVVMYHGSPAQFTIFDKKKAKYSGLYGRGFYFTNSDSHAATYGNRYSVYLNIRNPLQDGRDTVTREQVRDYLKAVSENEDYSIENYGTYDVDTVLRSVMGGDSTIDAYQLISDVNATAIGDLVEATELFNQVNGTKFDGIVVPTETVAFYPEQIKSATDNIGTFDGNNPDIRYSVDDSAYLDAVKRGDIQAAQRMVDEAADRAGYTERAYHGTNTDFNAFDWSETQRADAGFYGRGHYFATRKGEAELYGKRVIHAAIKNPKPFNFDQEMHTVNGVYLRNGHTSNVLTDGISFAINMSQKFPTIFGQKTFSAFDTFTCSPVDLRWDELKKILDDFMRSRDFRIIQFEDGHFEWFYEKPGHWRSIYTRNDYKSKADAESDKIGAAITTLFNEVYSLNVPLDPAAYYLGGDMDASNAFSEELKKRGYTGVIQSVNGDEIVIFDAENIKDAAPVTYDDNGNVIPLSVRFNTQSKDIRYSTDDSASEEKWTPKSDEEYLMDEAEYRRVKSELDARDKQWRDNFLYNELGEEGAERYKAMQKAVEDREKAERAQRAKENRKQSAEVELDVEIRATEAKRLLENKLLQTFSIPDGMRGELRAYIGGFADRIVKHGALTEDDRRRFFARMYEAGAVTIPADDYYGEARSYIKGGHIYVPDRVVAELGDDWQDVRRRAFAAGIYLTYERTDKNGHSVSGIDVWNDDLAADLPGLFDAEDTDETEILQKIIRVAEQGKEEKISLAEYVARVAREEYTSENDVLDSLERQMTWALKSFAETAKVEIQLKERNLRRVMKEREENRERAQRAKERRELQELQQKTLKSLRWLNKNRRLAPEELREEWDRALSDIDLYAVGAANEMNWSNKYQATWKDLAEMYKEARAKDPNFHEDAEIERIISRLDDQKIADMDPAALLDLYKLATGLRTAFYNRNNVLNDQQYRLFEEVYLDAKEELTSAGKKEKNIADRFLNREQLSAMNVLERMAGWNPDSAWYSMAKQLERGERDVRAFTVKANRILEDYLNEHKDWVMKADGQGKDAIWYTIEVPELMEWGKGNKPIFGDTVTVYMTPAQKVHMYLESKNLDNLRHMEGGRTFVVDKELYGKGKRQEALEQGRTIRLAPETVKQLVSNLTEEELELAQVLDQYYNGFATGEINRVSNVLYGYDKAMGKHYAPIYTNQNYTNAEFGTFDVTAEGVGNLKGRVKYSKNPSYNISAFDAFERNVNQTARFVGMAIPIRNWTTLMNWTEYKNSMKDTITHSWGLEHKRYIESLLTDLQGGKLDREDVVSETGEKLLSNYISSVFGFNMSIVLKQLGSIPLAGAYLGIGNVVPSGTQVERLDHSLIGKYTQDLAWRGMGYSMPETKQLKDHPNWTQNNKVVRFAIGGGAITAMDQWAASVLWPWAENKVRKEHPDLKVGTPEQVNSGESPFYKKVAEEFENAVARSQSTSDQMHQGTLRKSKKTLTRMFTIFTSDSAQTYNTLRQLIGEAQYYKNSGQVQKAKKMGQTAGVAVAALMLNALWGEAVNLLAALIKNKGKKYRDEEGEMTALSLLQQMGMGMLSTFSGVVVGGDALVEMIGTKITGEKFYAPESMEVSLVQDIYSTMDSAMDIICGTIAGVARVAWEGGNVGDFLKQNGNDLLGMVKETALEIASYWGIPAANVESYIMGALKFIPGFGAVYDGWFESADKAALGGLKGKNLSIRVGGLFRQRGIEVSDVTSDAIAELFESGFTWAVPSDVPSKVTINEEEYTLNIAQKQHYGRVWADVVADSLDEVTASERYTNASPEIREAMLKKLYSYAAEQAKVALFDDFEPGGTKDDIAAFEQAGLDISDYLAVKVEGYNVKKYLEAVINGLPATDADTLMDAIEDLEPTDGEDQVADVQKWRTIVDAYGVSMYQLAALASYMTDTQLKKAKVADNFDVDLRNFVKLYEIRAEYDENGNKAFSNAEYKKAIDSLRLSTQDSAVLWQLFTGAKSAKNNPYSSTIGQKVIETLAD